MYATLVATQNPYEVDLGRTTFIPGFCVFMVQRQPFGVSRRLPQTVTQRDSSLPGTAHRPGRSPIDAVRVCRPRCFKKDWVVDLDVKAFFDSVSWDLMLKAVARHTDRKWVLLYVQRWLQAPMLMPDKTLAQRVKGTPQGGPISPLIANVFLHYGFDMWMVREYPTVWFERFADDVVVHCVTERQARMVQDAIGRRLAEIGLLMHPDKTRIVYCRDSQRRLEFTQVSFTFCGSVIQKPYPRAR